MATSPPQSQNIGDAEQEHHSQESHHGLFKTSDENSALSNKPCPCLLQHAQASDFILEGYTFFKVDALPGSRTTWARAERTPMFTHKDELLKMVRERAFHVSAAQQYFGLSGALREHLLRLIDDRKFDVPNALWSCVYAKEHKCSSERDDKKHKAETVAMDIILMRRPRVIGPYPQSPMGDIVDLNVPPKRHNKPSGHKMDTDAGEPESKSSSVEGEC